MKYLNKEQTDIIRKEVQRRGIKLPGLAEDIVDFVCTAVEQELQHEPDFRKAFHNVLATFTTNELKLTQERTEELLSGKLSLLQKIAYSALAVLGLGFVLLLLAMPFATTVILGASVILVVLYFYSNIRWYFTFDTKSHKQKLVFSAGLFVVFLLLLGFIFKLNHYPGGDILMVSSLAILIFLPVLFSIYFFIRQGNTQIRFILPLINKHKAIVESIMLIMLVLGFIARFLLINGLGNMLIIVSLFCLSILFTSYTWPYYVNDHKRKHQFLLLFTSTICYVSFLTVALFKIMNWPLPFGQWNDISFMLLAILALIWYSKQFFQKRSGKYLTILLLSILLSCYVLLLFFNKSQDESIVYRIYNLPVLFLFIAMLLVFYKHVLFRALSVFMLGYYLLAFPYLLMPNKKIIENVYHYNPEFIELYNKTYSDPVNTENWKQLLEYEHQPRELGLL